jgi:hypothetical protein
MEISCGNERAGTRTFDLRLKTHSTDRGLIMADDKSKAGTADRLRINVHANYELRDWSKKFGVTVDELKEAVYSAGPMADEVERYLNKG